MLRMLLCAVSLCASSAPVHAQEAALLPRPAEELTVRFDAVRTILDDGLASIEGLRREPAEALRLPDVDTTGARYLSLFYSRDVAGHEGDPTFSVLALPHPDGLLLYPDLDNDEDLGNDGPPRLLAADSGAVTFALAAPGDARQVSHRSVQHVPTAVRTGLLSQEWFAGMTDEAGNLRPVFANLFGVDGARGTFLFDDRPVLARGTLRRAGDPHGVALGVYDHNANGRYDDADDLLLVDLDGDGRLTMRGEAAHAFRLDEVFEVAGQRYRLSYVDPYGRGARFVEADDPPTTRYLDEQKAAFAAAEVEPRARHALDSTFWGLALPTLDGDTLRLADLRGRRLLLNVWGEWCGACRVEMPMLAEADSVFAAEDLQIVGVLATDDEPAARAYLEAVGAGWPQVRLTDEVRQRFGIRFYPTNLLVAPAGDTAVEAGVVNMRFLEHRIDRTAE